MAKPTYRQAQDALLDHLEREGWKVARHLKVPHATSRGYGHEVVRIWFKPQALWHSCGEGGSLSNARSLWIDVREASPAEVVAAAERACRPDSGASRDRTTSRRVPARRGTRRDAKPPTTWVLQGNYGYGAGWEDVEEFTDSARAEKALKNVTRSKRISTPYRLVVKGSERHRNRGARRDAASRGTHYYCSKARASRSPHDVGGKNQCWPVQVLRHDDGITWVRVLAGGRFAGREIGVVSREITTYVPSGYAMAPGTRSGRDRETSGPPSTRRGLLGRAPASQRGSSPAAEAQLVDMTYMLHRAGYTKAPREIAVALRQRGVSPAELAFRLDAGEFNRDRAGKRGKTSGSRKKACRGKRGCGCGCSHAPRAARRDVGGFIGRQIQSAKTILAHGRKVPLPSQVAAIRRASTNREASEIFRRIDVSGRAPTSAEYEARGSRSADGYLDAIAWDLAPASRRQGGFRVTSPGGGGVWEGDRRVLLGGRWVAFDRLTPAQLVAFANESIPPREFKSAIKRAGLVVG